LGSVIAKLDEKVAPDAIGDADSGGNDGDTVVVDQGEDDDDEEGVILIAAAPDVAESAAASARPGMVTREGCASLITRGCGTSSSSLSTRLAHLL
jgi:hypothetical protein